MQASTEVLMPILIGGLACLALVAWGAVAVSRHFSRAIEAEENDSIR